MTRADILLTINSNLEGIRKANEAFIGLQQQARTTSNALGSFGRDFNRTLMAGLGVGAGFAAGASAANAILGAVRNISGALNDAVNGGVRFNATLESAQLSVAAVLKQFDPERYRSFGDAVRESEGLIAQLKKRAKETSATFEQLLEGFQSTAGAMTAAGIPLRNQIDLLVTTSQAMAALGINAHELRQELTALLTGNIDRNARLAKTLETVGVNNEAIAKAKEQGRLLDFLTVSMSEFAAAGKLAGNTVKVLESNLEDTKIQAAADATKNLTEAYKQLLVAQTAFAESSRGRGIMGAWANVKAFGQEIAAFALSGISGNSGTSIGEVSRAAGSLDAFKQQASGVRSDADMENAINAGLALSHQVNAAARLKSASEETREQLRRIASAVFDEVKALEQQGQQRIKNNQLAAEEAKQQAEATRLANEAAKAREAGAKKYAEMQEKERAAIRDFAKTSDVGLYLQLLSTDRSELEKGLADPRATTAFYLRGAKNQTKAETDEADKAAAAYRMEIAAKLAALEKEVLVTRETQARIAKTERDERSRADIRYLQVKAQDGTLTEKIAALEAEKNALEKTSLNHRADALAIEMRIAKLKDDEAAQLRSEAQKAEQRAQQAGIDRIRNDQFLTQRTKQQLLFNAFKQEEANIEEKIAAARALIASQPVGSATQAQAQQELDALLNRRDVGLPNDLAQNRPLTMMEDMKAGLVSLVDSFSTIGTLVADTLGTALQSISSNLTGLIMQTQTWGQALRNIATTILSSVVGAIIQASVQWVARKIIEFALGNTLRAAAIAANLGTAMALSTIWATPATLATIATFGGAAAAAPLEIGGAMAAVHGLAMFAKGGYTGPGGVNDPAGIVHKGEVVFSQRDISRLGGVAAVEAIRVRGGGYMANASVTAATTSAPVEATGGGGETINQAFFGTQQDAEQWLYTHRGRRVMTDFIKGMQWELP